MRYALRNSKWPFVFMVLFPTVVGTMFLVALAWIVHPRWFALPQIAKWPVMLIFVVVGGLVARMIAALVSVSGLQNVIEADPQERILRVVNTDIHGAYPKAIPFNDCWEMRLTRETRRDSSAVWCLSVVSTSGAEQPLARFDQLDEALDVAARLAAEIGCSWYGTPFPLERPSEWMFGVFLPAFLILHSIGVVVATVSFVLYRLIRPNPKVPLGISLALVLPLTVWGLFCLSISIAMLLASIKQIRSQRGFAVHVRTDARARVLRVRCRRGLLGLDTRNYSYDDIAEILAETAGAGDAGQTGEAGELAGDGAARERGRAAGAYGVRIVLRDDVARSDVPWDGAGGSGPPRDDTVFRSRDRDEARLTAERLARRIGRPWRDATA